MYYKSILFFFGSLLLFACSKENSSNPISYEEPTKESSISTRINLDLLPFDIYDTTIKGNTYYVAVDGNDSNEGSMEQPWKSWGKAFKTAKAGDLVYFREGVYYSETDLGGERDFNKGTPDSIIRFFNYPGEKPILDCSRRPITDNSFNGGITMLRAEYIHMKGLEVRNVFQGMDSNAEGIGMTLSGNIVMENMVVHHVGGEAFVTADYHGIIHFINSDAYEVCDSNRTAVYPTPGSPGQNGAGFHFKNYSETPNASESKLYYTGCRAWDFSDNGFAGTSIGYVEWNQCWAFNGGMFSGDGCGFKYASTYRENNTLPLARTLKYCISAMNGAYGFSPNNNGDTPMVVQLFNNSAYHNGYKENIGNGPAYGWFILKTNTNDTIQGELYANNLAYDNEKAEAFVSREQTWVHQYNSFDIDGFSLNNQNFLSLDWTEMKRSRKSDGSLPDIQFLKPAIHSPVIDVGMDVGLYYNGEAPDLGAFEYNSF